jgi:hypothetical protein
MGSNHYALIESNCKQTSSVQQERERVNIKKMHRRGGRKREKKQEYMERESIT